MPFIKVYIHFVWSTKDRIPTLNTLEIRQKLWHHIKENSFKKDIVIDFVNGHEDHCHCLVSLGVDQTIKMIMQLIKGEAAFWFNNQDFIKQKLEWQDEYFAVSVSESQIETVRNYIKNQEEHHKHKTFQQEYDEFITKYGFKKFKDE
jgi:REP element-mobilizing transposase RayT